MKEKDRSPKIGLIGLTAELYQRKMLGLVKDLSRFSDELKRAVGKFAEVIHIPIVYTKVQMEETCAKLKKENVDGIILIFLSYSPSLIIAPVLRKYEDIPILLWNTQKLYTIDKKFKAYDTSLNHGMHGVQDTANVLLREKIRFSLITGPYQDKEILTRVEKWCKVCSVINLLKKARIGRIGGRFKDMGDFAVSDKNITEYLGPEIVDIPLAKIASESGKISNNRIKELMAIDRKKFKVASELSEKVHFISSRLELSLRRIIAKETLSGLGINFMGFKGDKGCEAIPFMAIGKFLAEGMGYAGEGDVLCATSVLILQRLVGMANFVEMFTTDYKNNRILLMHMGESNPKMAKNKNSIKLVKKELKLVKPGLATAMLLFPIRPGKATFFNIASDENGKFKFIVAQGEVLDKPLFRDINSPHFLIRVPNVKDFLTQYSLAGGTHHLAMTYGDKKPELKYLADLMNILFIEICGSKLQK